jgi:hypothetical protein
MKLIPLTRGLFVQVDDWCFEELNQYKWYANKSGNTYYACRNIHLPDSKKFKAIKMHRLIMNTPDGQEVDHKDHNGLNCLEENMRNCTHKQNMSNYAPFGVSKYLGVSYTSRGGIRARIKNNGRSIFIGLFLTEEDAARAYDKLAKEHHGEFANLNFK